MNKNDLSRYFSGSRLTRVPLYKALLALGCALLLVVGTGAGIAVTAVNAAANSASQSSSVSAPPTQAPTATPEATATPDPTATPEPPKELSIQATAVQQSLGITVMDKENDVPLLGEDFEVTLKYTAPKSSKSSSSKASSSTSQKEVSTYNINPKTGTLLIDKLAVGDYTITLTPRDGYVMPEPATATVKEKVTYKADTEAVKDKIKNESEVGAGDIVNDNKVIDDQTSSNFDPTQNLPSNDYDLNEAKKEEVKANVYTKANNTKSENGKDYLLNADGTTSDYYVSKWGTTEDKSTQYIIEATLDKTKAANSVLSGSSPTAGAAGLGLFGLLGRAADSLFFPAVYADEGDSSSTPSDVSSVPPTEVPTETPTPEPTPEVTPEPTVEPTAEPTPEPTAAPTAAPTPTPTPTPTPVPSPTASPTPTPDSRPETIVLYDTAKGQIVANSSFKLTATSVVMKVLYSGWYPSFEKPEAYYDPGTHQKITGQKVIAGVKYEFDGNGKYVGIISSSNGLVKGIDVSKYQGNINWNQVKASGIEFAIIRVGYRGYGTGALVEDSKFRQNIQGATNAGLKVGLYFYSQAVNEQEAVEEASMVLRLCKSYRISYPIYFDTEKVANDTGRADSIGRAQRTANAVAFCETIRDAGYRPGVYSYASWFYNELNMANLTQYSVWIAQYRDNLTFNYNYDIWQYTSSGSVPGISGRVDMNVSKLG